MRYWNGRVVLLGLHGMQYRSFHLILIVQPLTDDPALRYRDSHRSCPVSFAGASSTRVPSLGLSMLHDLYVCLVLLNRTYQALDELSEISESQHSIHSRSVEELVLR